MWPKMIIFIVPKSSFKWPKKAKMDEKWPKNGQKWPRIAKMVKNSQNVIND